MQGDMILLLPIFLPIIGGIGIMFLDEAQKKRNRIIIFLLLMLENIIVGSIVMKQNMSLDFLKMAEGITVYFSIDMISRLFMVMICIIWLLVAVAAFEYMHHEKSELRFFGFYLILNGVLIAMAMAGNLITMYMFYELATLTSMPLVLHSLTHESIMAALKYTFYSIAGAFMVLFGIFVISSEVGPAHFVPGGFMNSVDINQDILLFAVFLMLVGFGTKAGMFPMHGWLPTAHPVAPAPASAVLSGIITKAGVLGVIRTVYFVVGPDYIRGTWVQMAWLTLIVITIFMGSMMAYREKNFKKRLAYSTVSQVSYILFGLALLHPVAFVGALFHMIAHSLAKNTLFVSAGAVIYKTGLTMVADLKGIGRKMPVTMWCFLIVSLSLVGIPPTAAFVSKWYLGVGALETGINVFSWLGPVVLLVSAVLTAGYLLTIVIRGFFIDKDEEVPARNEISWQMLIPMIVMSAVTVILGIWPGGLIKILAQIASNVL